MPTICKVEGCENPVWNKDAGYCKFHMYKAHISTKKKLKLYFKLFRRMKTQMPLIFLVWD